MRAVIKLGSLLGFFSSRDSRYADSPQLFTRTPISQTQQDIRHILIGALFVLGPAAVVLLAFLASGVQ